VRTYVHKSECLYMYKYLCVSKKKNRAKVTPTVKKSGSAAGQEHCKVPSQKLDASGKESYPLNWEMKRLGYFTDASYACGGDANVIAFTEAAVIIGGCNAVEEFLGMLRLAA
jgi:hypothetical protein